ncbi:hypothetical protein [Pseudobacteriovorax antillogorgiicola]|uniref:Uncharacterized protein n=1 Tax=Pseudobacteriovorax antillogorgiicola TaxID=1513793 RepID=A0A1Y6BBD3_9BACT|nr:hypothetical protein [Pseudobacteriovorax antillogorgiicola]TCS57321.1 hypothetical protein EDD56_10361 [Pseudobacteriovorax antillogorgiicola]SMF02556.1 hypothetical protein SAMN06296036_103272 [Pseudobacteriovorax antillogorgiicola]
MAKRLKEIERMLAQGSDEGSYHASGTSTSTWIIRILLVVSGVGVGFGLPYYMKLQNSRDSVVHDGANVVDDLPSNIREELDPAPPQEAVVERKKQVNPEPRAEVKDEAPKKKAVAKTKKVRKRPVIKSKPPRRTASRRNTSSRSRLKQVRPEKRVNRSATSRRQTRVAAVKPQAPVTQTPPTTRQPKPKPRIVNLRDFTYSQSDILSCASTNCLVAFRAKTGRVVRGVYRKAKFEGFLLRDWESVNLKGYFATNGAFVISGISGVARKAPAAPTPVAAAKPEPVAPPTPVTQEPESFGADLVEDEVEEDVDEVEEPALGNSFADRLKVSKKKARKKQKDSEEKEDDGEEEKDVSSFQNRLMRSMGK